MSHWIFAIDVGGTFTDVVAWSPSGECQFSKVLSSGRVKITELEISDKKVLIPKLTQGHLYSNYKLEWFNQSGLKVSKANVVSGSGNTLYLSERPPVEGVMAELYSGEVSPILAIRQILGLSLEDPLPKLELRLGTTRGTNALLERKGARSAWVTSKGFADQLLIGDQTRPELFKLDQPEAFQLPEHVFELDERLDASGKVLKKIEEDEVENVLCEIQRQGIDSLGITLIHSYLNPVHEEMVRDMALKLGISQVSASIDLCPHQHFLDRARTTTLDAYLSPVIKDYLNSITRLLQGSKVYVMDSAGGLKQPEYFMGKDSILSGPAGGVVAIDSISKTSPDKALIGFDMGGTSTDVCRHDGQVELEKRSEKAGLSIVTPSLAIETVAAGGGSICYFDGQRLRVGPESAGSDPGPACYGKGGPLSVTDLNVWLGRVHEEHFPFKLNRSSIEHALIKVYDEIQESGLEIESLDQLARDFLKLANFTMAQVIRKVSARKGYAPQDHSLVCFGGAGGQHAAELADELGIKKVSIHPLAGVLSAWGMSQAKLSIHYSESCRYVLNEEGLDHFESYQQKLIHPLKLKLLKQACLEENINFRVEVEIKSQGMESGFFVTWKKDVDFLVSAYRLAFFKCFAYQSKESQLELVSIRVELFDRSEQHNQWVEQNSHAKSETNEAYVIHRDQLACENSVQGPKLIIEACSCTYVPPSWSIIKQKDGSLELLKTGSEDHQHFSKEKDALGLEIFTQQFTQIASQMGVTLQQTSRSVNVKERMDFSCAILDAEGELVVNAPHIPVHLGAMGEMLKNLIEQFENIQAGDVFLSNDPYLGGSHLPDLTVMTPVFDPTGQELRLFLASRAHHSEMGGVKPGSCYPFAENLEEEGVVFRHLKICEGDVFLEQQLKDTLLGARYPSRNPDENIEDIKAAIAANNRGVSLLNDWIEQQTWSVVHAYLRHLKEMSKAQTENWIKSLKEESRYFEDEFDDGTKLCLAIQVQNKKLKLDFTGTSEVHPNSLNATPAIVRSALLYSVRCLMSKDLPLNQGVLEALEITIPTNTCLNPASYEKLSDCAAVVAGNVEVSQKIVDVFLAAMGVQAASQGTMNNVIFGNTQFGYYETISGGTGATSYSHGASAWHAHMTNTKMTDVEILEDRYPVRLLKYAIRKSSGGRGRFCGGDGVERELEFLEPLELNLLTQRRKTEPFGLHGAQAGLKGENVLVHKQKKKFLDGNCSCRIETGDRLEIRTPGGGGFNL